MKNRKFELGDEVIKISNFKYLSNGEIPPIFIGTVILILKYDLYEIHFKKLRIRRNVSMVLHKKLLILK